MNKVMWPDGRDNPNCICGENPNVNCDVHVAKFPPLQPDIDDLLQEIFRHGYEFSAEFPGEDISKVTDSCVAAHKQALYDRLAAEAVEIEQYVTGPLMKQPKIFKAVPISKLKEIFEVTE